SRILQRLHDENYRAFVATAGFGVGRMGLMVYPRGLEAPSAPPIQLPKPYVPPNDPATELPRQILAAAQVPTALQLTYMHERGLLDFLDRRRMGYIESRNRVIGFEPHAFGQIPSIGLKQQEAEPWQLIRLELISLLRHPEPVAYISDRLPRMDELKKAPTRPLD